MRIILTNEEAQILAKERINTALRSSLLDSIPCNIEIETSPAIPLTKPLQQIIKDIESLNYSTSQKIPAIKTLRTNVPSLGLAEAKWAVENWEIWKRAALQHGRPPNMTRVGDSWGNFHLY